MRRPSTAAFYSRPLSRTKSTSNTAPANPALSENPTPAKSPSPVPSVKEARTWEHDRQRLKKTAAFVKSKARKAQHGQAQAQGGWSTAKLYDRHSHSAAARALLEDDEPVCGESEVDWDDAASPLRSPRVELGREGIEHAPLRAEVPLADLLISRKPRHGRDSGFEVVPPIRSVIVLDDTIAPDLDFDEPWEHVSTDDADEREPEPSYAKIAALN
ncbi:hypothetical protein D9615_001022 [Tricholomella constricta]|uniref:Uncharacterized protein n=1 Tax=Tricholomella constricta TaxID=117010 RepID=A0A8H5HKJ2_9AGAR|nr:hypothetical protein D9615_001022 [Tricholomella constricta]